MFADAITRAYDLGPSIYEINDRVPLDCIAPLPGAALIYVAM